MRLNPPPNPSKTIMNISVTFHSYFKDLTGIEQTHVELSEGATLADLLAILYRQHPRLADMERSTLIAVGVEYQNRDYPLQPGDRVALFPPVQGG